jgi:N-acetylglucosaminyl-diphospho-decaprenol L-rhamnosyltransferase
VRPLGEDFSELADLAIVIVSTNEAHWLQRCLSTVFDRAGGAKLDVIVVDNSSTDGTHELVELSFPKARVVSSPNRGFAYGNNRGIEQASARYVLLLNPDTEVIEGTFAELVELLDARPQVGLVGVRQVTADGTLWPTIRRFPSVARALGEALLSERWPVRPSWAGERVLDQGAYEREGECDWTSGSFMLARREALLSAGLLDERFFIYSEEPDLCLRIKRAGWQVRHLPQMTIVHHAGKGGVRPRMIAQDAYTRKQYAHKHFGRVYRGLFVSALAIRHAIRFASAHVAGADAASRREGALCAIRTLTGKAGSPFGSPPPTAVAPLVSRANRLGVVVADGPDADCPAVPAADLSEANRHAVDVFRGM